MLRAGAVNHKGHIVGKPRLISSMYELKLPQHEMAPQKAAFEGFNRL
jgi:hypothetical protein